MGARQLCGTPIDMASAALVGHTVTMDDVDDAGARARFESALSTEYFVLQGASGATISESSSRSSLYMVSLSSSLIALGFVLNASEESFLSFAAVVLPVLFLLGTFTVVRLVDTSVENVRVLQQMARIRRHFAGIWPPGAHLFGVAESEVAEASRSLGLRRANRRAVFFTMATVIGAVNAVVGGAIVVLVVTSVMALPTSAGVIAGVVTAAILAAIAFGYQLLRFASLFPRDDAASAR